MAWRTAYLRQARSDYEMLASLLPQNVPLCHKLHYLQMTTEKLAKGFLTPPAGAEYAHTHDAFLRFVRVAQLRPEIQVACGFKDRKQFSAFIRSLLPVVAAIEDLSPDGAVHPNPEYPWFANQQVHSPLDHPFHELNPSSPRMIKLLQFINACFSIA
jgi:hypothetical protein